MRRRGLRRHERQLQVVDDAIDYGEIGDKGNDLYRGAALGTADLAFFFIEGEAFQGTKRPDHVFAHPLGLFLWEAPWGDMYLGCVSRCLTNVLKTSLVVWDEPVCGCEYDNLNPCIISHHVLFFLKRRDEAKLGAQALPRLAQGKPDLLSFLPFITLMQVNNSQDERRLCLPYGGGKQ